ncbi:TM2 domain-containing protein [[Mycoplasma] gypis]|uniref:TM2 domain-containing protein n=1 Tax=[Mycoplasma] gypis TaxID=92404 RepID=A0ABZ2RN86_9BACT|nr:TM2 domain-containing protein [[Mycoplasma] gypis]MBN0919604.1 TM2 domain-containing protein [[Mycoplasma] gypis]
MYKKEEILEVYQNISKRDVNTFLILSIFKGLGVPSFYLGYKKTGFAWLFFGVIAVINLIAMIVLVSVKPEGVSVLGSILGIVISVLYLVGALLISSIDIIRCFNGNLKDVEGKKLTPASDKNLLESYLASFGENSSENENKSEE